MLQRIIPVIFASSAVLFGGAVINDKSKSEGVISEEVLIENDVQQAGVGKTKSEEELIKQKKEAQLIEEKKIEDERKAKEELQIKNERLEREKEEAAAKAKVIEEAAEAERKARADADAARLAEQKRLENIVEQQRIERGRQVELERQRKAQQRPGYSCNCSKTCPNMNSCEEAYFQLNTCGCSVRDGDDDGVPCENIC